MTKRISPTLNSLPSLQKYGNHGLRFSILEEWALGYEQLLRESNKKIEGKFVISVEVMELLEESGIRLLLML